MILKLSNISKAYKVYSSSFNRLKHLVFRDNKDYYKEISVLKDINLIINKGETVGLVGKNGSGKSTLLQIISGILEPTDGECIVNGKISSILELGAGFNPEYTGKENIYLYGTISGLSLNELNEKYDFIVNFSGLGEKINQPVKTYSSGMYIRLAFSVAISIEPDILIIDEALAVGDEVFQKKCFDRIRFLQKQGVTILFVSHSAGTVVSICDKAILLDDGELLLSGEPKLVVANYHKLIFANENKVDQIKQSIRELNQNNQKNDISILDTNQQALDITLIPETRVEYIDEGAQIYDNKIFDPITKEEVNYLESGNKYIYSYKVKFQKDIESVNFGMLIKNISGIDLGGAISFPEYSNGTEAKKNDIIQVNFEFLCCLIEGTYFLNCGCFSNSEGKISYISRIVDERMFKVIKRGDATKKGMIDFNVNSSISNILSK